jgi:hypothetical protein
MPANTAPIFSKVGAIGQSHLLTTAANDYNGVSLHNRCVFYSDATNGGFIQRIRFKARGTNVATVARIYIGRGWVNTNFATAPAAPTGTPSTTGGTMLSGAYFATIIAVGPGGSQSVIGSYSASVSVTGPTGSIAWTWTAVAGATSYRIYVTYAGGATGTATRYFTSSTNSYTQTTAPETGTGDDPMTGNQFLFGELSLPATTASASAATPDIEYSMNLALPPDHEVLVGLGTTVAAGWQVSAIGGAY